VKTLREAKSETSLCLVRWWLLIRIREFKTVETGGAIMSKKFLIFIEATMLAIGLSACGATADEFEEEPEVAAAPGAPITIAGCHFQVDRPHGSTHFPGTVNVIGWIQCNRSVERIEMTLGLALNGVELKSATFANSGSAYLKGNVAVPCVSGTYNGAAVAKVTFPPGSLPRIGNGHAGSGNVDIICEH
jgi:hypothetical protein